MRKQTINSYKTILLLTLSLLQLSLTAVSYADIERVSINHNLDMMLLIDNSKSMKLRDQSNFRMHATEYMINYLYVHAESVQANYRIGFVKFSKNIEHGIPLHVLTEDSMKIINQKTQEQNQEGWWTNYKIPLSYAFREFKIKSPGMENKKVVILLTDGQPKIPGLDSPNDEYFESVNSTEYFQSLKPMIKNCQQQNIHLFVLCLAEPQQNTEDQHNSNKDKHLWLSMVGKDYYYFIDTIEQLSDILHKIFSQYIGVKMGESESIVVDGEKSINIQLIPFLQRVIFSFVKSNKDIEIQIKTPGGNDFNSKIPDTESKSYWIVSCDTPDEGIWNIYFKGKGIVQYWMDTQSPDVKVALDVPYPYTTKPFQISGMLFRDNQNQIIDSRLNFIAEIRTPDDLKTTLHLNDQHNGIYKNSFKATNLKGTYYVKVQATVDHMKNVVFSSQEISTKLMQLPVIPESEIMISEAKTVSFRIIIPLIIVCLLFIIVCYSIYRKKLKKRSPEEIKQKKLKLADIALKRGNVREAIKLYEDVIDDSFEEKSIEINERLVPIFRKIFNAIKKEKDNSFYMEVLQRYLSVNSIQLRKIFSTELKYFWVQNKKAIELIYMLLCDEAKLLNALELYVFENNDNSLEEVDIQTQIICQLIVNYSNIIELCQKTSNDPGTKFHLLDIMEQMTTTLQDAFRYYNFAREVKELYTFFQALISEPLYPIQIKRPKKIIQCLETVFDLLKESYTVNDTLKPIEKKLKGSQRDYRDKTSKCPLPEKLIFWFIHSLWLDTINKKLNEKNIPDTKAIELYWAQEISYQKPIESDQDLILIIENMGNIPIYNINFNCADRKEGTLPLFDFIFTKNINLKPGEHEKVKVILNPKASRYYQEVVEIECHYSNWYRHNKKPVTYLLKQDGINYKNNVNPYIPDYPLQDNEEFETFHLDSRQHVLDNIVNHFIKSKGSIFHLCGLRRLGKSSLINELRFKEEYQKCFLTVYNDCNIIKDTASNQKFKFEDWLKFLKMNIDDVYDMKNNHCNDDNQEENEVSFLELNRLTQYLKHITEQLSEYENKKLILIFDDVHLLLESIDTQNILQQFSTITNNSGCSIILISENITGFHEQDSQSSSKFTLTNRLKMLSDKETEQIILLPDISIQFTHNSIHYIWRMSGGYTSLVQVICYDTYKKCRDKGISVADIPIVQEVVKELIQTEDNYLYLKYIIDGLSHHEWEFLIFLVFKNRIDSLTLALDVSNYICDHYSVVMNSLNEKGIIEKIRFAKGASLWKLKVGFFKLWIEAKKINRLDY